MFVFTFGDIGSGKSLEQATKTITLLEQSVKIEKKYKLETREIWCNYHLNEKITEKYKDRLRYWRDPLEMIFKDYPKNEIIRLGIDVCWDEMAVELPSDKWLETNPEIRRFFAQHRKRGIRIFGNTQDYMMVDINARRMATEVQQCHKVIGTRDPSPTLPKLKHIWGIIFVWELNKLSIRQDDMDRKHLTVFPKVLWITKKNVSIYNTGEDIYKEPNQILIHRVKTCPICGIKKVIHT